MSIVFTSPGSLTAVTMPTAFQTLADDTASATATVVTVTTRNTFRDFVVQIGAQGGARDASAQVSLLIIPDYTTISADVATLKTAQNYIARDRAGRAVTWTLDAATTARDLTWSGIMIPAVNYYIGVLNETAQAFAGTNAVWATDPYTLQSS